MRQAWSHKVYGGAEAAAAAGFIMPAPEKLPRFVDIRTWQAYLEQLKGLVQSADIEKVGKACMAQYSICMLKRGRQSSSSAFCP